MVRTTIACARCRKAKIKCVHDGLPPCQSCIKEGSRGTLDTCVLTGPILKRKKLSVNEANDRDKISAGISSSRHREPRTQPRTQRRRTRSLSHQEISTLEIPRQARKEFIYLIIKASNIFVIQFPELDFLHIPSFLRKLKDLEASSTDILGQNNPIHSDGKLVGLCSALLALCAPWLDDKCPREDRASTARSSLSVTDLPNIYTVQTQLILAMYEWGRGRTYRAWTDSGMATRSFQLLSTFPQPQDTTEVCSEIQNRTFWACFAMDRLIFCGKPQPLALPLVSVEVHWPVGQTAFAFGNISSHTYPNGELNATTDDSPSRGLDRIYFLLVQGYDIWSKILQWIASGGRRRPCSRQQPETPWTSGSIWHSLYKELQDWRKKHGKSIRFPDTAVEIHVSLRQAHNFAHLNLLYYLCLLFLGREYIPFLPTSTSQPSGPVDPPLLTQEAPTGWWEDRADELFSSSAHMTDLLRRLDAADASIYTPFSGFCAFSAATMNVYVLYFPRMNLGRSMNAAADVDTNRAYFDRFRTYWAIGSRWWATIETTQRLYERASRDRAKFFGKTRKDFQELEAAIHHCASEFPSEMDTDIDVEPRDHQSNAPSTLQVNDADHELGTPLGNQSVPEIVGHRHHDEQILDLYYHGNENEWNAIWPLWEDQLGISFALDSISWEHAANSATIT